MARVKYISREELSPDRQDIYDRIAETRGRVPQVFQALLNSPDAAAVVAGVGEYLRYRAPLDPVVREIAILSAVRELKCEYEWAHHVPVAREVGVRDEVIDSIRSGRAPMGIPAKEGVFAQAARELVREGTLGDRTFQAILHLIGPALTVDLIVLVGYYSMLARVIKALGVELEPGMVSDLPG